MLFFTLHVIQISHNTQQGHNLGPIQQGTSRPLHKHEPIDSNIHTTLNKPLNLETFSFRIKPQSITVSDCVKTSHEILYHPFPSLGTKSHGLIWPPISNPYHYMTFIFKVNQVGKSPTLWSLSKLQVFGIPM